MKDIDVLTLKARLDNGDQLYLLDVREAFERAMFHIGGSLIPLNSLPSHIDELPKDEEIVIYCRSGKRSDTAKQYLLSQGFTQVRNLLGGMLDWQQKCI